MTTEAKEFMARMLLGCPSESLAFLKPDGTPWSKNHHQRPFAAAVEKDWIDRVVFHELRHTFASTLLMDSVNPVALAKAMGHKDTHMIEKHYGHLIPGWPSQEIDCKALRLDLDLAASSRPVSREPKPVIELDPRLKNKLSSGEGGGD